MEAAQVPPNFHGSAGIEGKDDKIGRTAANEPPVTGPRSAQYDTEGLNTQEDWLPLAAADPAFWLKETIVNEERIVRKVPYE